MNKNIRKNKTNRSVTWPTSPYFTIVDLQKQNKTFVNITLRVRLSNAIKEGEVAEIGVLTGGKGRPQKVFALTPISKTTLAKAESENIVLIENANKLINVVSVTSQTPVVTPSVTTTTNVVQ